MNTEIDKEFAHVIFQTLNQALSSDKTLIDQAQQQLNVLQIRKGYLTTNNKVFYFNNLIY